MINSHKCMYSQTESLIQHFSAQTFSSLVLLIKFLDISIIQFMMVIFQPGDVVIECYPLVKAISAQERDERCNYCFEKTSLLGRCSDCLFLRYCGYECQRKDLKNVHKYECGLLSRNSISPSMHHESDLIFRAFVFLFEDLGAFFKKIQTPNGEKGMLELFDRHMPWNSKCAQMYLKSWKRKTARYLAMHEDKYGPFSVKSTISIPPNMDVINIRDSICLRDDGWEAIRQTHEEFISVLDLYRCGIRDNDLNVIGSGIYFPTSIYEYSCDPNCCITFDGTRMQMRATKEFNTDGQPLLIAYIPAELLNDPNPVTEGLHAVCRCESCSSTSEDGENLFTLNREFEEASKGENIGEALKKGLELLECLKRIFPSPHPYRTILLKKLVKMSIELKDDWTVDLVDDFKRNYMITHGTEHSLYSEVEFLFKDLQ
ncbi:histone-lysine N-methyltransferase SMYD3-like [Brevipalpus obovatus]|uniref:histone-lysine N-methyltransferase SMYD3-like n=1 Tax=Brevipalpus obovatus TaxID=246614 RepID=UPI003D9ECBEA